MHTCNMFIRRFAAVREIAWEQLPAAGIPAPALTLAAPAPAGSEEEDWSQKSASPHHEKSPQIRQLLALVPPSTQSSAGGWEDGWEVRSGRSGNWYMYPHLP